MTDHPTLRVVHQPVRRQVEDALRKAIVHGRFLPGEHLSDRVLCELIGASRSVVREAMRLLEAEGLILVRPNRGPVVAALSSDEAAQIYEVRAVLEALAGENFARKASEGERAELRRAFNELATMSLAEGREAILATKQRFYDVLIAGCQNDYVARMLGSLLNRIMQLRATSLSAPERFPQTVAEIRRVVEAIDQRDPVAAWGACRDHVNRAAAAALTVLRQRESSGSGEADAPMPTLFKDRRTSP